MISYQLNAKKKQRFNSKQINDNITIELIDTWTAKKLKKHFETFNEQVRFIAITIEKKRKIHKQINTNNTNKV